MAVNLPPSNSPLIPLSSSFFSAGKEFQIWIRGQRGCLWMNYAKNLLKCLSTLKIKIFLFRRKIDFHFLDPKMKEFVAWSKQSKVVFEKCSLPPIESQVLNLSYQPVIKRSIWIKLSLICKWICLIDDHLSQILIDGPFHTLFLYSQDLARHWPTIDCHHSIDSEVAIICSLTCGELVSIDYYFSLFMLFHWSSKCAIAACRFVICCRVLRLPVALFIICHKL